MKYIIGLLFLCGCATTPKNVGKYTASFIDDTTVPVEGTAHVCIIHPGAQMECIKLQTFMLLAQDPNFGRPEGTVTEM